MENESMEVPAALRKTYGVFESLIYVDWNRLMEHCHCLEAAEYETRDGDKANRSSVRELRRNSADLDALTGFVRDLVDDVDAAGLR